MSCQICWMPGRRRPHIFSQISSLTHSQLTKNTFVSEVISRQRMGLNNKFILNDGQATQNQGWNLTSWNSWRCHSACESFWDECFKRESIIPENPGSYKSDIDLCLSNKRRKLTIVSWGSTPCQRNFRWLILVGHWTKQCNTFLASSNK